MNLYKFTSKSNSNKEDFSFLNCGLRKTEILCISVVLIFSLLLQLTPVLASNLGDILLIGMACVSWMTPVSGFAYISASQALPIPETSVLNPAQVGFFTWIFLVPFRYKRYSFKGGAALLWFFPLLIWFWTVSGQFVFDPQGEYVKALFYGLIGIQLANESRGEHLKSLMGLCLGCMTVSFAYWAYQFGLPVELSEFGGERLGFARLGGVRADSVMIWPPLLMGCFGFLGLALTKILTVNDGKVRMRFCVASFLVLSATVPVIISTMTNAALIGFVLMSVFLFMIYFQPRFYKVNRFKRKSIFLSFIALFFIVFFMISLNLFDISSRITALYEFYEIQSYDLGVAASRTGVWEQAIELIIQYPLIGVLGNDSLGQVSAIGSADMLGNFLAHNVFLDYGWQAGFPGLGFVAMAFFAPVFFLRRKSMVLPFVGFICFYFACFIFWMALPFQFYKTFWAFWALFYISLNRYQKMNNVIN